MFLLMSVVKSFLLIRVIFVLEEFLVKTRVQVTLEVDSSQDQKILESGVSSGLYLTDPEAVVLGVQESTQELVLMSAGSLRK